MQLEVVKDYYGKLLKSSKDLKTSACCDGAELPPHLQPLLANVHPGVVAKYYGCGIVVPAELKGRRVLDLGSGSGRDTYILAQLVGPEGEVVGVDMTEEQLATANAHSSRGGGARPLAVREGAGLLKSEEPPEGGSHSTKAPIPKRSTR